MKKLNDFSLKNISELEKEINEKKKLLKKAKEEQKAKLIQKAEVKEEEDGMKLTPFDIVKYKLCPNCSAKIKKTKVKKSGLNLIQSFTCRQCGFHKELKLRIY